MITEAGNLKAAPPSPTSRIPELDALRALAMVYIVGFWHLFEYAPVLEFHKVPLGLFGAYLALGLFVFISGFLLARRYDLKDRKAIREFFSKRFLRVYPMYLAVLVVFLVAGMVNWVTFLLSAPLLNMIVGRPLPTLWFISLIFVCYALTPVYLHSYRASRVVWLTIVLVILFLAANRFTGWIDTRLPQYLTAFAAGIVTARSDRVHGFIRKRYYWLISLFLTVGVFWAFQGTADDTSQLVLSQIGLLVSLPFFFGLAKAIGAICPAAIIQWIGYGSFALYLVHRIVYKAASLAYHPQSLTSALIYFVGLAFPFALVCAWVYQRAYDAVLARWFIRRP